MLGGMVTAPLLSLFVIPAAYLLMRKPRANVATRQGLITEALPFPVRPIGTPSE